MKPMRPGGFYPCQLGIHDEYREVRKLMIAILVALENRILANCDGPDDVKAKAYKLFNQYAVSLSVLIACIQEFTPERERSDMFDALESACVSVTFMVGCLRVMENE